ncbi:MAG: exo-alpha-sialidase [Sphaerochaetaceae bacterium]|nr:exo-alpha-sialidase [Sphaerochaetaceae bacterium]
MRFQPLSRIREAYWYAFNDEPIATRGALKLCDPAYLLPEESPDGLWHMFAHTWIGLEHFTSTSGLEWKRGRLMFCRAHSPFIFREGGTYWLFYEIHDRMSLRKNSDDSLSASRFMVTTSNDLILWSKPKLVLDSTKITRAQYKEGKVRISRPQIVDWKGRYRLYFGAGETRMYDTRQKTTARLMYAESDFLDKEWRVNPEPILEIEPDSRWRNLAVGSVRIVPCSDGLAAFECAYYYDRKKNKSSSAVLLLTSQDGISWKDEKVIQESPEEGWAGRYITSVDVRFKEGENTWYCYYSANGYSMKNGRRSVKESLGLLLGADTFSQP